MLTPSLIVDCKYWLNEYLTAGKYLPSFEYNVADFWESLSSQCLQNRSQRFCILGQCNEQSIRYEVKGNRTYFLRWKDPLSKKWCKDQPSTKSYITYPNSFLIHDPDILMKSQEIPQSFVGAPPRPSGRYKFGHCCPDQTEALV